MDLEKEEDGVLSMTELINKQRFDEKKDDFLQVDPKELSFINFYFRNNGCIERGNAFSI